MHPKDVPDAVHHICRVLRARGYRAWVVGGCLRDLLRGATASDWDLATDARPEVVCDAFPRVIPTGLAHGTVTVRHHGEGFEVTTLRGEGAYSDGRRPDSVEFVSDIREDLARRDFTINALAYDPLNDVLEDPFGGMEDLARSTVRAVGDPLGRFSEDGLRVLRAARFTATLEFTLDPATEAAIRPTLDTFRRVAAERVHDEWLKALRAREPSRAFSVMERTGILEVTCPQLSALDPGVFARTLAAVDRCVGDTTVRLAVLLCPIAESRSLADWLARYRFANSDRERVERIVRHAWPNGPHAEASDAVLRRFAADVGRSHIEDLLCASEARASAEQQGEAALALRERLSHLVTPGTPLTAKELAVSGKDLLDALGRAPGPWLGGLIAALLESVLDDPTRNTRDALLAIAATRAAEAGHV